MSIEGDDADRIRGRFGTMTRMAGPICSGKYDGAPQGGSTVAVEKEWRRDGGHAVAGCFWFGRGSTVAVEKEWRRLPRR
jgi:hypothetical protein